MFSNLNDIAKAVVFYALAFGLGVVTVLLAPLLGDEPAGLLIMLMPLIAVVLMLLVVTRDGYSRAGWRALGLRRAGWRGWPLALAGPVAVLGFTYAVTWASGIGHVVSPAGGPADAALNFVIDLLIGTIFALGEEIGWRGYFLPHLLPLGQRRALLLSGLLHGAWHLPLLLMTSFYHGLGNRLIVIPLFLITLSAAGVCYGYLRLTTGSAWPAAILHGTFNSVWSLLSKLTIGASPVLLEYVAGESGIATLLGVIVFAVYLLWRLERQAQPARLSPVPSA
jgi:membrane protease YdiL (CAAX protease family)